MDHLLHCHYNYTVPWVWAWRDCCRFVIFACRSLGEHRGLLQADTLDRFPSGRFSILHVWWIYSSKRYLCDIDYYGDDRHTHAFGRDTCVYARVCSCCDCLESRVWIAMTGVLKLDFRMRYGDCAENMDSVYIELGKFMVEKEC